MSTGFMRGRLNGASVEDSDDSSSPSGERGAIVTVIQEDSDATGSTPIHVQAKVLLPNGVPCPLYAANMHLFGRLDGPPSIPLALAAQPHVLLRRDMSVVAGTTSCWNITVSPTLLARAKQKWTTTDLVTKAGERVELDFLDGLDHVAAGKLGYFPNCSGTASVDRIQPLQLVSCSIRTASISAAMPGGYTYAWLANPLNQGNTCPCKITGGSGDTYTADFYAKGVTTATETGVTVIQLHITGDTIPVDTWTIATLVNHQWYIQVPVWLA